jgi:hypothetical protein
MVCGPYGHFDLVDGDFFDLIDFVDLIDFIDDDDGVGLIDGVDQLVNGVHPKKNHIGLVPLQSG